MKNVKNVNKLSGSILLIFVMFFCLYGMFATINTPSNSNKTSSDKIIENGFTNSIQHRYAILSNITSLGSCNTPCDGPW